MPIIEIGRPWSIQKQLKRQRIPTPEELYGKIMDIPLERDRALVAVCYLTGGRISEIVEQKYLREVIYDKVPGEKHKRTKPYRILDIKKKYIDYKGITKGDISFKRVKGKDCMEFDMQNRKNKDRIRKQLPVLIDKELKFIEIINNYRDTLKDGEPLFPFGTHRAHEIIKEHIGINAHFMRDIRATHLVTIHHLDAFRLQKFCGWKSLSSANRYVTLDTSDIWDKTQ